MNETEWYTLMAPFHPWELLTERAVRADIALLRQEPRWAIDAATEERLVAFWRDHQVPPPPRRS
ncbi:hypothetical protein [Deinococcus soli (ex Cha et al. 2016)]|uniref:Uncharacterized protein n=2 Tax=Deinococcus soli (ex Cha et al. 2016) TaxID=1309411 RepID=A0AAE4BN72_9DEIO|nr:hypothetical protein [Deinococcus soli (ex Cha et al. 2016)]MDR6218839.1 hypothetical protein [Deinococcus soli (ex Cha et al. 2016)]MDR6328636.1 hypothetical protein [Deinococcus soli (ex Cha et al. 2016)]MDR6751877.1 hypothetical protein [Deinococcus soli (ex Cha et al. 2016)]